jgi:hypothetical protein
MDWDIIQSDIDAIKQAGGGDKDITSYLDSAGVKYEGGQPAKDVGEIRPLKRSVGGEVKNALIGGAFGNVFLRNNPNPELEKRRQLTSSLVNTATLGIPQAVAGSMGSQMAPVKAPLQAGIGSTLGMATPAGLAGVASKAVRGAGIGANALRGAIQGGVFGAALPGSIEERKGRGMVGAGVGGALGFITSAVPKLVNLGGRKTAQKIAEKADKGMDSLSQGLSDKYDDVFSNIKATTKSQDVIKDIQATIDEFPEGANVGKLKSIISRLSGKDTISAKELFAIKKEIGKTIPRSVWNGISDTDAISNSKEGLYWRLSKKLEEIGGDKYKGLTEEYKNFKQAERLARKMFYRQGVPSNLPVSGSLDIPTQRAIGKLSSQLPSGQRFAKEFEAWRRGQAIKSAGKKVAPWIPAMLGLGYMGSKVMNSRTD